MSTSWRWTCSLIWRIDIESCSVAEATVWTFAEVCSAAAATAVERCAVRSAVGRDPLFRSPEPATGGGFAVESAGQVVGHLRFFNAEWLQAAHVAACLARSPLAMAALLEAGGPDFQEHVGRILSRNLRGEADPRG